MQQNNNYRQKNNLAKYNDDYTLMGTNDETLNTMTETSMTPINVHTHRHSNHKMSYNQINLFRDDINNIFKSFDEPQVAQIVSNTEKTHQNMLDETYNANNNRYFKQDRIHDYKGEIDFLDNNVNGVKEVINEYIININSVNRDCNLYPNPFNYKVLFNAGETHNANITRLFKNIKYINLKSVIVPNRCVVIKKQIYCYYKNSNASDLIQLFTAKNENEQICVYEKIRLKINDKFYCYYYKFGYEDKEFYILTYDVFLDMEYRQKISINITQTRTNRELIENYFNEIDMLDAVIENTIIENNNFILIYDQDNKIKFCPQNDNFNESIDKVFEIKHDGNTIELFDMYVLTHDKLSDDRYLLLGIKEIESNYEYSTDDSTENAFSILFPDYYTDNYYYLDSSHHEKMYNGSTLGNITKMTINFQNSSGNNVKINYGNIIDNDITTPKNKCICGYDTITGEKIRNYQCAHSYLRHCGYEKLQNTLLFKVGVLEGIQDVQHI